MKSTFDTLPHLPLPTIIIIIIIITIDITNKQLRNSTTKTNNTPSDEFRLYPPTRFPMPTPTTFSFREEPLPVQPLVLAWPVRLLSLAFSETRLLQWRSIHEGVFQFIHFDSGFLFQPKNYGDTRLYRNNSTIRKPLYTIINYTPTKSYSNIQFDASSLLAMSVHRCLLATRKRSFFASPKDPNGLRTKHRLVLKFFKCCSLYYWVVQCFSMWQSNKIELVVATGSCRCQLATNARNKLAKSWNDDVSG